MRRRLHRGSWPAIALLVLAALVCVMGADFLPHTDDGCQVETHCLACRTAFSRATPVVLCSPAAIELAAVGSVLPALPAPLSLAEPARVSSRGPPTL
jgi:hypothetical protein